MAELQENKICRLTTPLGDDVLLVSNLKGREAISELFQFELTLVSEDREIDFKQIIGKSMTIEIDLADDRLRYVNGIVSRFRELGPVDEDTDSNESSVGYQAEVVAWPWLMTRRRDCRIFQNKSVPEIVEAVFKELQLNDYKFNLDGDYEPRVNCVQYNESDFDFISRLLESEGIYYFFEHEESLHRMVLVDSPKKIQKMPDMDTALFQSSAVTEQAEDRVETWHVEQVLQPGKYSLTDYNFNDPATDLLVGAVSTIDEPTADKYDIFDYPGDFVKQGGEEDGKLDKGDRLIRIRREEGDIRSVTASGRSSCRAFLPGYHFDLEGHARSGHNQTWLLVSVEHELDMDEGIGEDMSDFVSYRNRFTCTPYSLPWRPPRRTPRPRISGLQTALVVGPSGEEIYVDKHGRAKVQFHWDRYGEKDENSSCWVRVAQNWAGKAWGILFHPRIGQEVVVEFLEGDPDRPLITGRVYNGAQPIPYDTPTQSGIKTHSTKEGSAETFNEIRFEDKKGGEELYIHAEMNETTVVENDQSSDVGNDRTETIGNDKTSKIGNNKTLDVAVDHEESIGSNMKLTIGADRKVEIGANLSDTIGADRELTIGANSNETVGSARNVTVGAANTVAVAAKEEYTIGEDHTLDVGGDRDVKVGGDQDTDVGGDSGLKVGGDSEWKSSGNCTIKGKKITIQAKSQITLKAGGAQIVLKKSGDILIKGKKIQIKGSGDVKIKGSKITQN